MTVETQRISTLMQRNVSARSALMVGFFERIFEHSLGNSFHSVQVANKPPAAVVQAPHLVLFSNHSSWWDGVLFLFIARRLLSRRPAYVPMQADMVERYGFFKRIGAFGIEKGTTLGSMSFLEGCRTVLANPRNVLMITAQGRFADSRERPVGLAPGIAHIVKWVPKTIYLPLAIEYTFWDEKLPELLFRFGSPICGADVAGLRSRARLCVLEQALTKTMDDLAQDAIARQPARFDVVLTGRRGINPAYDLWQRLSASVKGRSYNADHRSST